jgi:hypothetical protein
MELAASVGVGAVAGVAGLITSIVYRNRKGRQEPEPLNQVENALETSVVRSDGGQRAGSPKEGQLVSLFYEERQVHATNAPKGAIASLSELPCHTTEGGLPMSAVFWIHRRDHSAELQLVSAK